MKCKYCGQEIDDGSLFCGYCGKQQPQTKICINCGQEIDINDVFCGYCGHKLEESNSVNESKKESSLNQERTSSHNRKPAMIVIIASVVLASIGGGLFFYNHSKNKVEYSTDTLNTEKVEVYEDISIDESSIDTSSIYNSSNDKTDLESASNASPSSLFPFAEGTKLSNIASKDGIKFAISWGNCGWGLDIYYKNESSAYTNIFWWSIEENKQNLLTPSGRSKVYGIVDKGYNTGDTFLELEPEDFTNDAIVKKDYYN